MALNIDLWSDSEIIKDAINIIEGSAKISKELASPVLRLMKKIRKYSRYELSGIFHFWVPKEDEFYFVLDPLYAEDLSPVSRRKAMSWASFQPARMGFVFQDQAACLQTAKMLQVLGKLANISCQQRSVLGAQRFVLAIKRGRLEVLASNTVSLVGFSSRENALLAWDTLTEEEQASFYKGFGNV